MDNTLRHLSGKRGLKHPVIEVATRGEAEQSAVIELKDAIDVGTQTDVSPLAEIAHLRKERGDGRQQGLIPHVAIDSVQLRS